MSNEISEERLEEVNGGTTQKYTRYTVVRGDTIERIARRFGVSVQSIIDLNPVIDEGNELRIGWVLIVPINW